MKPLTFRCEHGPVAQLDYTHAAENWLVSEHPSTDLTPAIYPFVRVYASAADAAEAQPPALELGIAEATKLRNVLDAVIDCYYENATDTEAAVSARIAAHRAANPSAAGRFRPVQASSITTRRPTTDDCVAWLHQFLASHGPVLREDVAEMAAESGFTDKMLRVARHRLGADVEHTREVPSRTFWSLPDSEHRAAVRASSITTRRPWQVQHPGGRDRDDEHDYTDDFKRSWLYQYLADAQAAGEQVRPKDAIAFAKEKYNISRRSVFRLFKKLANAGMVESVDGDGFPRVTYWQLTSETTAQGHQTDETTETTGPDLHKQDETTGKLWDDSETTGESASDQAEQDAAAPVVSVVSSDRGDSPALGAPAVHTPGFSDRVQQALANAEKKNTDRITEGITE